MFDADKTSAHSDDDYDDVISWNQKHTTIKDPAATLMRRARACCHHHKACWKHYSSSTKHGKLRANCLSAFSKQLTFCYTCVSGQKKLVKTVLTKEVNMDLPKNTVFEFLWPRCTHTFSSRVKYMRICTAHSKKKLFFLNLILRRFNEFFFVY